MQIKVNITDIGDLENRVGTIIRNDASGFTCSVDKVIEMGYMPYDTIKIYPTEGCSLHDIVNLKKTVVINIYVSDGERDIELVTGKCSLKEVINVQGSS